MANVKNSAIGNTAVNMISLFSLPDDLSSCVSPEWNILRFLENRFHHRAIIHVVNMPNDQSQFGSTTSWCRPFRAWKLMRKWIPHALRELCISPEPLLGETWIFIKPTKKVGKLLTLRDPFSLSPSPDTLFLCILAIWINISLEMTNVPSQRAPSSYLSLNSQSHIQTHTLMHDHTQHGAY